jgi:hypothetical protein
MPGDHTTAKERERVVLLFGGRRYLLAAPDRRQRPAGGERPPGEQLVRCGPVPARDRDTDITGRGSTWSRLEILD